MEYYTYFSQDGQIRDKKVEQFEYYLALLAS